MKNKLFNWSYRPTSDRFLNYIKRGINNSLSDDLINNFSIKRMLKQNSALACILLFLIMSNTYSYFKGSNSREHEVKALTSDLKMIYIELGINDKVIDFKNKSEKELKKELQEIKESREYMVSIIDKEAGIKIPERVEDDHLKLMFEQADYYDLPYKVYFRVINQESKYKYWVVSSAGAEGYMQVMPRTYAFIAKELDLPEDMTAESNIKAGSWYLRRMYDKQFNKIIHRKVYEKLDIPLSKSLSKLTNEEYEVYCSEVEKVKDDTSYYNNDNKEVWELALSAYNAGSSNVGYNIPNITETQAYVKYILKPYYES